MALMVSIPVIRAHVSRGFPLSNSRMDQAGTGGARSRTIRARICPNMRADTATSAVWKVRKAERLAREWLEKHGKAK